MLFQLRDFFYGGLLKGAGYAPDTPPETPKGTAKGK
jgi:hypothetical protein